MTPINLVVKKSDGWKRLPAQSKGFTQNDTGTACFAEATVVDDLTGKSGEKIYPGVPYRFDVTNDMYIKTVNCTCNFGVVTEV